MKEEMDRERKAADQKHKENMERIDRRMEANHQKHLKEMDEIENGPPIPHPIIPCSIPSPSVDQKKERKFPYVYFNW